MEDGPLAGARKSTLRSAHRSALQAQKGMFSVVPPFILTNHFFFISVLALEASPPPGLGEPAQSIPRGQIAMKDVPIRGFSMAYLHQICEPLGSLEEFSERLPAALNATAHLSVSF